MVYKGKVKGSYILPDTPMASGGEGEIYLINGMPDMVAKLYKPGKIGPEKESKLIKMVTFPPDGNLLSQIAWPKDMLYDHNDNFVGFVMPKLDINEDLNVIYESGTSSKFSTMLWENRIIVAENLCAVLQGVHAAGHVCGDFNPKNISVNPNTGFVSLLDTDSYHIQDANQTYRCGVGIPEYIPYEIQMKMRGGSDLVTAPLPTFSQETDKFALAVHIFQLLMNGAHPYACAVAPGSQVSVTAPQPSDNIIKGDFPYMQKISGVQIPLYAPPINILPKNLQKLFRRAFIAGHTNPSARPGPEEWHKALKKLRDKLLTTCSSKPHHQYYKSLKPCPWCALDEAFNKRMAIGNSPSQSSGTLLKQSQIISPPIPGVTAPSVTVPGSSASSSTLPSGKMTQMFDSHLWGKAAWGLEITAVLALIASIFIGVITPLSILTFVIVAGILAIHIALFAGLYDGGIVKRSILAIVMLVWAACVIVFSVEAMTQHLDLNLEQLIQGDIAAGYLAFGANESAIFTEMLRRGYIIALNTYPAYMLAVTAHALGGLMAAFVLIFRNLLIFICGTFHSLEVLRRSKSGADITKMIAGTLAVTAIMGIVVFIYFFGNFDFLSSMRLIWVIDQVQPFMGGSGQSFPIPQYAAFAMSNFNSPDFLNIFLGYVVSLGMTFIPLSVGAMLSAGICLICDIDRKKIGVIYGIVCLGVFVYMFFNPANFTGHNFMFVDLEFYVRVFAILTPLLIGTLFFTMICKTNSIEDGTFKTILFIIPFGYVLLTLIAAGIQNQIVGLRFWSSGDYTRVLGYHLPWIQYITVGSIVAFIVILPSLLFAQLKAKANTVVLAMFVGAISLTSFIGTGMPDGFNDFASRITGEQTAQMQADVFHQEPVKVMRLQIGKYSYMHWGTYLQSDAAPFISPENGRAMVPLRLIAEGLGARVGWDAETQTVLIERYDVLFSIATDTPLPNDMGTPAVVNGQTFVPATYVAEMLGASVRWDDYNQAIYIYQ